MENIKEEAQCNEKQRDEKQPDEKHPDQKQPDEKQPDEKQPDEKQPDDKQLHEKQFDDKQINDEQTNETQTDEKNVEAEPKVRKAGFFKRVRRRFSTIFRKRQHRRRAKSDPGVIETRENADVIAESNCNLQAPEDIPSEIAEEDNANDTIENSGPAKPNKLPLFGSDFTAELKLQLKQRSKKLEENEKSPTEAVMQIEMLKSFNSSIEDDKIQAPEDTENWTFEEKRALFESQTSGGSGSLPNSLRREIPDKDFELSEKLETTLEPLEEKLKIEDEDTPGEKLNDQKEASEDNEVDMETVEENERNEINKTLELAEENRKENDFAAEEKMTNETDLCNTVNNVMLDEDEKTGENVVDHSSHEKEVLEQIVDARETVTESAKCTNVVTNGTTLSESESETGLLNGNTKTLPEMPIHD